MTEVLRTKTAVREAVRAARGRGLTVGFVPTMGALHEGHLSLVRAARETCGAVLVSVFVNPAQFGPTEDLATYPRDLGGDAEACTREGVDWMFAPSVDEMYGDGQQVLVDPGRLAAVWEGASRPGHFAGVATVVVKLLAIANADTAFFGEKDYQQLRIVERLVSDLDLPVGIVPCPIVRDEDGVALSSRNLRLDPAERRAATWLFRALSTARDTVIAGERDAAALVREMRDVAAAEPLASLDYAAIVDPLTLEPLDALDGEARALVAGKVGDTRLIDNMALMSARRARMEEAPAQRGGAEEAG